MLKILVLTFAQPASRSSKLIFIVQTYISNNIHKNTLHSFSAITVCDTFLQLLIVGASPCPSASSFLVLSFFYHFVLNKCNHHVISCLMCWFEQFTRSQFNIASILFTGRLRSLLHEWDDHGTSGDTTSFSLELEVLGRATNEIGLQALSGESTIIVGEEDANWPKASQLTILTRDMDHRKQF